MTTSEIGAVYLSVLPSAKGFGKELNRVVTGADVGKSGQRIGTGILGGIGKVFRTGAGLIGLGSLTAAITTPLVKGFSRLTAIENATAKLRGLGHSAETVSAIMANALAAVKGTSFGMDEAATTAAGAIASGVKPGRDLERTLKLVADSATIAGTDMGSMGAIFNKVASSGKVQGDVIAQLHDRGVPVLQFLAKEMGVTAEEAAKLASNGAINFDTFRDAMEKNLGGAALESGNTTQGAFKNMLAAVGRVGANLLDGVFPYFQKTFKGITGGLEPLEEKAKTVGEAFGQKLARGIELVTPPAKALAGWISEHREGLGRLTKIVGGTALAVTGLRVAWQTGQSIASGWRTLIKTLTQFQTGYGIATTGATRAVRSQTRAEKMGIVTGKIFAGVQKLIGMAMQANPFVKVAMLVFALGAALVVAYKKSETFRNIVDAAFRKVGQAAGWLWENAIKPAWEGIQGALTKVGETATWLWNSAIKPAWDGIRAAGEVVWGALKVGFEAVGTAALWLWENAIKPAWEGIQTAFGALRRAAQPVVDWFNATIAPELSIIFDEVGKTVDHFRGIWENVWGKVRAVIGLVAPFIKKLVVGYISAYVKMLGAVMSWLWKSVIQPVWAGIQAAIGAFVTWFKTVAWPVIGPIIDWIGQKLTWLWRTVFQPAWVSIKAAVAGFVTWFSQTAWPIIGKVFGFIGETLKFLYEKVFKPYLGFIWAQVKNVFTLIGNTIGNVMKLIRGIIQTVLSVIRGDWSGALNGLKAIGQAVWKQIQDIFGFAIRAVQNVLRTAWTIITNLFRAPMEAGHRAIASVWTAIRSAFGAATGAVKSGVQSAWSTLSSIMKAPVEAGKRAIDTVLENIEKAFTRVRDGIGNIWDGIKRKLSTPINWVIDNVVNEFIDAVKPVLRTVGLKDLAYKMKHMARVKSFATGGWTGPGGTHDMAGIVHADEFVIRKKARKRFEDRFPGYLQYINDTGTLPGYAKGGRVVDGVGRRHTRGYPWATWAGDFPAGYGGTPPVWAWKDGLVALVRHLTTSYGKHLRINHDDGTSSLYAHLSKILVSVGQRVAQGQHIANVGWTGNVIPRGPGGAHLHFETMGGPFLGGGKVVTGSATAKSDFNIGKLIRAAVDHIIKKKTSDGGVFGDLVNAIPGKLVDGLIKKAGELLGLRTGGVATYSGAHWLSEDGRPELVVGPQIQNLHRGSTVFNADQTERLMGRGFSVQNLYVTLPGVTDADGFAAGMQRYALMVHQS